jgi:hypothetical protein
MADDTSTPSRPKLLAQLQTTDPAFVTWLLAHPNYLDTLRTRYSQYNKWDNFWSWVTSESGIYTKYQAAQSGEQPAPGDTSGQIQPDLFDPFVSNQQSYADYQKQVSQGDLLGAFQTFLTENELPGSLLNFIKQSVIQNKSFDQIVADLRQTPEYKAAYPENELRQKNGLSWMSEADIRSYRDEARRVSREYLGVNPTNADISELIGRGTSLRTWEHRLVVNQQVERWGGAVQQVFEQYTGAPLSQEQLHAFMDADINTERLDQMYQRALMRGQPAQLGFGVRPEEEAALLQQYGINPEQVFTNYQQIAASLPKYQRLGAVENYLKGKGQDFFGDVSVEGSLLFRAVQLGDPNAIQELQRRSAEEAASWQAQGGPLRRSTQGVSGLSVPGQ